jgi:hypothetical protein
MISSPFSASSLIPSLVAASTVGTGFGVFVCAACVADAGDDGVSLTDAASDEPQADKRMEAIKSRENIFFMCVILLPTPMENHVIPSGLGN